MKPRTYIPLAITFVGGCWQFGMMMLSWVGRLLDAIELGDYVTDFQVWLVNNPNFVGNVGPWFLIVIGLVSLLATHLIVPLVHRLRAKSIEIIFEPNDPSGKFGTVDVWIRGDDDNEEPFTAFILRIGVKNNTAKTLEDVSGTIEGDFAELFQPSRIRFTSSRKLSGSVHPGSMELMDLFALRGPPEEWVIPEGVRKVIVRARAKDTEEQALELFFDKSKFPPLYRKGS